MAAVAEKFIPCVGLTGSINGVGLTVTSGGFGVKVNVDDMTNNQGYGFYEDVKTTQVANFKMTVAALSGGLTGIVPGSIYPVLINCATFPTYTSGILNAATPTNANAPCFAGNVRVQLDDVPLLDPTKGVKYSFTGMTQGQFDVQL